MDGRRLIDADKLKRKCQKTATEAWKMKIKASAETIMNQFIDFIDETDTVDAVPREIEQANKQAAYVRGYEDGQKDKYGRWGDAVPVVRCRDCKFYHQMTAETGICKLACRHLGNDGFCSEGERKDGDRHD